MDTGPCRFGRVTNGQSLGRVGHRRDGSVARWPADPRRGIRYFLRATFCVPNAAKQVAARPLLDEVAPVLTLVRRMSHPPRLTGQRGVHAPASRPSYGAACLEAGFQLPLCDRSTRAGPCRLAHSKTVDPVPFVIFAPGDMSLLKQSYLVLATTTPSDLPWVAPSTESTRWGSRCVNPARGKSDLLITHGKSGPV